MMARRGYGLCGFTVALITALAVAGCGGRSRAGQPSTVRSPIDPGPTPSARPSPSPSAAPVPAWRLADSVPLRTSSLLHSVVAVDATHAWAGGAEQFSSTGDSVTLPVVERWNGRTWTRETLPDLHRSATVRLMAAGSPTDVWAVGTSGEEVPEGAVTWVLHYDGTAWREVPFPVGSTPSSMYFTGAAVTGGHLWLVGTKGSAVIIQEWDGRAWHARKPPTRCERGGTSTGGMPNFCTFTSIVAFAPDDVWACGNGSWSGFQGPSLFHWDGTTWQTVDVGGNQQLYTFDAIGGRSSGDLWAVGNLFNSGTPYVVHGGGSSWTVVGGLPDGLLPGVALDPAGRPWVISNTQAPDATLNLYAPSGSWASARAPRPPDVAGVTLNAITAVPGTDRMFAVGQADLRTSPLTMQAVILEYSTSPVDGLPSTPALEPSM